LIISVWFASCIFVIKKWSQVLKSIGHSTAYFLVLLYVFSLSGVVLALILSLDLLLWTCIILAILTNVSIIITAIRVKEYKN
jgi:VIT1/CCC1 family predicted Fe2+/Mn2+ transporter